MKIQKSGVTAGGYYHHCHHHYHHRLPLPPMNFNKGHRKFGRTWQPITSPVESCTWLDCPCQSRTEINTNKTNKVSNSRCSGMCPRRPSQWNCCWIMQSCSPLFVVVVWRRYAFASIIVISITNDSEETPLFIIYLLFRSFVILFRSYQQGSNCRWTFK